MKRSFLLILTFVVFASVYAQKQITVEDFTTKNTFAQKSVTGINWMKDGQFYSSLSNNKIIKFDITTGKEVQILLDGEALSPRVAIQDYSFSADESKLLLLTATESIYRHSFTAEYFVYDLTAKKLTKLSPNGRQSYASFSPDGSKVAFVRGNNLFYTDLATTAETQVTDDGKFNFIINGTTDWVYEEEFSFVVGFHWSPDG